MFKFKNNFTDWVAARLRYLLQEEADPKNPYVAILYAVAKEKPVDQEGTVVVSACNTESISGNPNAHAERNVLKMAAKALCEARIDSTGMDIDPSRRKTEFFLFVNTRPCPECTKAILDDEIFSVVLLYDNGYKKDESESLIRSKETTLSERFGSDVQFTFAEISDEKLKREFRQLTESLKSRGTRPCAPAAPGTGAVSAASVPLQSTETPAPNPCGPSLRTPDDRCMCASCGKEVHLWRTETVVETCGLCNGLGHTSYSNTLCSECDGAGSVRVTREFCPHCGARR